MIRQTKPDDEGDIYANIRQILGGLIGEHVVDITQHDETEWKETGAFYLCLHFSNGATLTLPVDDAGFDYDDGQPDRDDEERTG